MGKLLAGVVMTLMLIPLGCSQDVPSGPSSADLERERAELAKQISKRKNRGTARAEVKRGKGKANDSVSSSFASLDAGFSYDGTDRRDPFQAFRIDVAGDDDEAGGPLEQFELEQLRVVAVVWDANRPRALVTGPSGSTFVVGVGSQMGKNDGHVIHIGDNLVLVKETYVDFAGEQTTKDVELLIRRSQGG